MSNTRHALFARTVTTGLLALVCLVSGCGDKPPLAPSSSPQTPSPRPPLVVTAVSESLGSTAGGASVKIEGTGFLDAEGGPRVLFGGVLASSVYVTGFTTIFAIAPAHAAGQVDLVVNNPDGQSGSLAGAYTYAAPGSFDSNGEWEGTSYTGDFDFRFRFTVQNNRVTVVSCDTSGTVSLSPAPSVSNGEFALSQEDGVAIAGRLVSPRHAIGTINLGPCTNFGWFATKQP